MDDQDQRQRIDRSGPLTRDEFREVIRTACTEPWLETRRALYGDDRIGYKGLIHRIEKITEDLKPVNAIFQDEQRLKELQWLLSLRQQIRWFSLGLTLNLMVTAGALIFGVLRAMGFLP